MTQRNDAMKFRIEIKCQLVVFVTLIFFFDDGKSLDLSCPEECFCFSLNTDVQCSSKNFKAIPDGIPHGTLSLNLVDNKFSNSEITRRNFSSYPNIQQLYLRGCGIETIGLDTFADLKNLTWLDLGNNRIRFIADFTFRGLRLKHLFLNNNDGIKFSPSAFVGMSLYGLYLQECELRYLSLDVLTPIKESLQILWLDNNHFVKFSKKWLYLFKNLGHLRLGGNNFHCNCELQWLHTFVSKLELEDKREDHPLCGSPPLVQGKIFKELSIEEFRCTLPTFKTVDAIFEGKIGKLRCQASGDPAPSVHWVRPDGTIETSYPKESADTNTTTVMLYMPDLKLHKKDGYKCLASNPAGNVTFSLNVVWPDQRTTTARPRDRTVIKDRVSSPKDKTDNKYVGDDSGASYDWHTLNSEKHNTHAGSSDSGQTTTGSDGDNHFGIADIIGAVLGTFILTVLLSVTIFHFYYRRRERERLARRRSVPSESSNNREKASSVYFMNDPDENLSKMVTHENVT